MDSLIADSDQLTEIYALMQRQCSHRLSKISLFIMKIGDVRLLHDSGCKWVKKESSARQSKTEFHEDADFAGIVEQNKAMEAIETKVADVLRQRMMWLKEFVTKVEAQYALLETFYDEISEYAVTQIEEDDQDVRTDSFTCSPPLHSLFPFPSFNSSSFPDVWFPIVRQLTFKYFPTLPIPLWPVISILH